MSKKITSIAVDKDLWRRFKGKVAERGKTLTAVLNEFIRDYLNQSLSQGIYHVTYDKATKKYRWTHLGSWLELKAKLTE